jgi:hypothetical protein
MMKIKLLYTFCFSLLFASCGRRYLSTGKACNGALYIEFFRVNAVGIDAEYLTDSVSFRHYIGTFDPEHERYTYTCNGDSIDIKKFRRGDSDVPDTVAKLMEHKVINLAILRREHKFE